MCNGTVLSQVDEVRAAGCRCKQGGAVTASRTRETEQAEAASAGPPRALKFREGLGCANYLVLSTRTGLPVCCAANCAPLFVWLKM